MIERIPLPAELDAQLKAHFERSRAFFLALGERCPEALILGGGYGRGEGGVARDLEGHPCFFNDLDYFVFTKHFKDSKLLAAVARWEVEESALLGIDVEAKCLPESDLAQTPQSMMFFDLVLGHTIVLGPKNFLEPYQSLARSDTIDPSEATRLLWNRGTGLLFARVDLASAKQLDAVHRNQAKVKLALGDSLLALRGRYKPSVRERQVGVEEMEGINPRIQALHREGVAFKFEPTSTPGLMELLGTQLELVELWRYCFLRVESKRLGQSFVDAESYIGFRSKLFPDTRSGRNLLLGLRDLLFRGGYMRPLLDYPRGALQRGLLVLLEPEPDYAHARKLLGQSVREMVSGAQTYQKWWDYYS